MNKKNASSIRMQIVLNLATILIVALLVVPNRVFASKSGQINLPGFVPYQGNLTDSLGNPLNGLYDMIFRFYAVPEGGTPLWEESHLGINAVPVSQGLFQVNLGSLVPIPDETWNNTNLYLGINVENDPEMMPRQPIGYVPASLHANFAQQSELAQQALTVPNASITGLELADYAVRSNHFAPTYLSDFNTAHVLNASSEMMPTGVSVTFTCETDCLAWITHRGLAMHSAGGPRVNACVFVDNECLINELTFITSGFGNLNGNTFVELPAGQHTVDVRFANHWENTTGTAYYYGDASGTYEHLHVILFAQTPD